MKLTSEALKKLIKEELEKVNEEAKALSVATYHSIIKKSLERIAKLETQVGFLVKYYEETSKEDFETKRKRFEKSKPDIPLQEGVKNDD